MSRQVVFAAPSPTQEIKLDLQRTSHLFFSIREIKENIFILYNGLLLPKHSPLTKHLNDALARMRAGGLITHYMNDPLNLEQVIPLEVFTFYDDSKDKLTMETFTLLFIYLAFGMVLALLALIVEIIVYRRHMSKVQLKPKKSPKRSRKWFTASKKQPHRVFIGK